MTPDSISQDLYDLLVTQNFDPETTDGQGQPSQPDEGTVFSFDYTGESGKNYGTAVLVVGEDNDLMFFFGDNLGRTMEEPDKSEWFQFLQQLSRFATQHRYTWSPKDLNKFKYTMQGMAAIKEGLFEGYYGTRKKSYMGEQTTARLVINHNRIIGENDKRYRYVESLFIETAQGECFKLGFKNLSGGKAMLEHVRQGGNPYNVRGQHITELVTEANVLSRFNRASQHKMFEGVTQTLVEQAQTYYKTIKENLKHMASSRGYKNYFESWSPADIGQEESLVEDLKTLFVEQSIDSRIETALPLLAKIQQQGTPMKEAEIFENWVNNLAEGTWEIPDTPEQQQQLIDIMSQELPVGADATNATEQLYNIFGDDILFDNLEELARRDPDADARQVVYDRLQELSDHPAVAEVLQKFTMDRDTPAEPGKQGMAETQDIEPAYGKTPEELGRADAWYHRPPNPDKFGFAMGTPDRVAYLQAYKKMSDEEGPTGGKSWTEAVDEGTGGSYFVVFDDGQRPYGPVEQQQAQSIAQRMAGAEVIPASQLASYQQSNRQDAMKGSEPMEADNLSTFEGKCNMTAEGEECPMHGLKECGYMENLDTDGVMMTRSESADPMLVRMKSLAGILAK